MEKPSVYALLICDTIITDVHTGKKSLIGLFENISVAQFPCIHPSVSLYLKFTDIQGKFKFVWDLVDEEHNKVISRADTPELEFKNKLQINDIAMQIQGLRFEHAGRYRFRVFANDILVDTKPFTVTQIERRNDERSKD